MAMLSGFTLLVPHLAEARQQLENPFAIQVVAISGLIALLDGAQQAGQVTVNLTF